MSKMARPADPQATVGATCASNLKPMVMFKPPSRCLHPVLPFAAAVWCAACTADADAVRPPNDQVFYPTGLALSPDQRSLLVASANSDLRYDSGTLTMLDLDAVDRVANAWTQSGTIADGCTRDLTDPSSVVCDETQFIRPNAGVRIGNFATNIGIQDFGDATYRVILPVRGDPSVTWIDGSADKLTCSASGQVNALCDDTRRLTTIRNSESAGFLPEEPYAVVAQPDFALISHLSTGALTLVDSARGGDASIADVIAGLFAADLNGLRGATGVAARGKSGLLYAVSRTEDRVQMLTVDRGLADRAFLLPAGHFFLDAVGTNSGGSADSRDIAFSANGDRMFVLNRRPPSVQMYDTSAGPTGVPRNRALGATDICRTASSMQVVDVGAGDRVYVACFADGTINVVDPNGRIELSRVISVGRGPFAVAVSPLHRKLYVTNFLEDTIGVVDLTPGAATAERLVLRIGERKL